MGVMAGKRRKSAGKGAWRTAGSRVRNHKKKNYRFKLTPSNENNLNQTSSKLEGPSQETTRQYGALKKGAFIRDMQRTVGKKRNEKEWERHRYSSVE